MGQVILLIYIIAGYWATGQTIYANKILIGTWDRIILGRLLFGALLGWILIPWAIIKSLIS